MSLLHTPIKSRVMKLLWALSPQHCFIKDDTIIFYQLTKNADKPWFNKMQSVARRAHWFCCSGVIAHELQGVVALGSSSKTVFSWQLSQKKVGVLVLEVKSDISVFVIHQVCHALSYPVQHILSCREITSQVCSQANYISTFPPLRNT